MEILKEEGKRRLLRYPRAEGGWWYRSEDIAQVGKVQLLLGTSYETLKEAEADFSRAGKGER